MFSRFVATLKVIVCQTCCVFLGHPVYYFETIKMMSQAQSKFTENTRLRLLFSIQNLTRLVTSFLWFQNNIDQAVS